MELVLIFRLFLLFGFDELTQAKQKRRHQSHTEAESLKKFLKRFSK